MYFYDTLLNCSFLVAPQADKTGCFSAPVDMSTFNLTGYKYSHSINIVASVVEEGTGKRVLLDS